MRITNKYWATSYESENVLNFIFKKNWSLLVEHFYVQYNYIFEFNNFNNLY